jgi:hypothetical protein
MMVLSSYPYRVGAKRKKEAIRWGTLQTYTLNIDTPSLDPSATARKSLQCLTLGAVAQMGEHLPCTQGVVGSNPIRSMVSKVWPRNQQPVCGAFLYWPCGRSR